MKKIIKAVSLLLLTTIVLLITISCSKNKDAETAANSTIHGLDIAAIQAQIDGLPAEPLSEAEMNSLIFMREEEKLARDVYKVMFTKWNMAIFSNIASSEQTHMDAILMLLNKYELVDPVGANGPGVFTNQVLQNLYNQLILQGNVSIAGAYKVGAGIEELDISDLTKAMVSVDNQDISMVYNNLTKGSRNHLRSFYKKILWIGETYTPQYLTPAAFDAIINSPMETGNPW
jgi:hypothetical protein